MANNFKIRVSDDAFRKIVARDTKRFPSQGDFIDYLLGTAAFSDAEPGSGNEILELVEGLHRKVDIILEAISLMNDKERRQDKTIGKLPEVDRKKETRDSSGWWI